MLRKKSLLALLLSLCMVVGILPATVFAAGAGMPQNIRWAESPKSMVQWDAPSGGGQYQYELRLKLGETMAVGMAVPAFAANGPSSGDYSFAYLKLGNSEDGYQTLFANSGKIDDVSGAVYDKASNTVTLTNYNNPTNILVANEMGDDLKLNLVGDNHISELVVYGFGWGGNLEIIGDGSLTINENKTSQTAAIRFMAEGTQGLLKVGSITSAPTM